MNKNNILKKKLIRHADVFRMLEQKEISERIEKLVNQCDDIDFIEERKLIEQIKQCAAAFFWLKYFDSKNFDKMINDFKSFFSNSEKIKENFKREENFKKKVKEFIDLLYLRSLDKEEKNIRELLSNYNTTVDKEEKNTFKLKINAKINSYQVALKIQKEIEADNVKYINTEHLIKYTSNKLAIREAILKQDDSYHLLTTYLKDFKSKKHFSRTQERKKEIITLLKKKTSDLFLLKNNKLPEDIDCLFENFLLKMEDEAKQFKFLIEDLMRKLDTIKLNLSSNLTLVEKDFIKCFFIKSGKDLIIKAEKLLLDSKQSIDNSKRIYYVPGTLFDDVPTIKDLLKEYKLEENKNDISENYIEISSSIAEMIHELTFINAQNENFIFVINNSHTNESNKVNIISKFPVTKFNFHYYYVLTLNKKFLNKNIFQYDIKKKNQVKLISEDFVLEEHKLIDINRPSGYGHFPYESKIVIEKPINLALNICDILLSDVNFKNIQEFVSLTVRTYELCYTTEKYQIISIFDDTDMKKIKYYFYDVKKQVFTGQVSNFNPKINQEDYFLYLIFRKKVIFLKDIVYSSICSIYNIKIT